MTDTMLELSNVSVFYRTVQAVVDVSLKVQRGEILSLIGANGAGKSTILKAISGLVPLTKGDIRFKGKSLANLEPHLIVRQKVSQVPEGRGIFLNLTVEENLSLGAWTGSSQTNYRDDLAMVFELFPRVKERRKQNAGTLSGGEQQMLAIGRALMARPELLLLDEPSLGLAPQIIEKIFDIIRKINKDGKTILLVEQNARQALEIAHTGLVLEVGHVAIAGNAKDILASDAVRKAYLGG